MTVKFNSNEKEMYDLSEFFKIMGDSTRLKILTLLENGEKSVGQISDALGISLSAISHQLRILKQTNLITFKKQGKNVIYMLADEHVKMIIDVALEHINER